MSTKIHIASVGGCEILWESEPDDTGWFATLAQGDDGALYFGHSDMETFDVAYTFARVTIEDLKRLQESLPRALAAPILAAIPLPPPRRTELLEKLEAEAVRSVEHFGPDSQLHGINSWLIALKAEAEEKS